MKIDAQKFIDDITDEKYETNLATESLSALEQNPQPALQAQLAFMAEQINTGRLGSTQLEIAGEDINFYLQNGIVNLPYRYAKNISKMMSGDGECPLYVYMFVESPDVNRSQLRIDELATQDEFDNDEATLNKLTIWVQQQLQKIADNRKAAATENSADKEK